MSGAEWNADLLAASKRLDEAHDELDRATRAWAEADRTWRLARAESYVRQKGHPGTVDEKRSMMEQETAGEQYQAQLNEGLKQAALELVRSRRNQLSALQTLISLNKSEAELARYQDRMSA